MILEVANLFGRPIKVDATTAAISKVKFARLCIEIDISQPLGTKFRLGS